MTKFPKIPVRMGITSMITKQTKTTKVKANKQHMCNLHDVVLFIIQGKRYKLMSSDCAIPNNKSFFKGNG